MRIVASIIKKTPAIKAKFAKKKLFLRGDFTPFMNKSFQIWDHFFPRLIRNTSLFLGLQAKADLVHAKMGAGGVGGFASNLEHLPFFRAPREGELGPRIHGPR